MKLYAIILAATLTACSTNAKSAYGPAPLTFEASDFIVPTGNKNVAANAIAAPNGKEHAVGDNFRIAMANYFMTTKSSDAVKVKREVIGAMMDKSEAICSAYLVDVFGYRNTVSSGLSISSLALGAIGPLLSAGSTGPALSAAGTFMSDTNSTYMRSFYGDSDLSIVGRKIRADRKTARTEIDELLKDDSDLAKISFGSLSAQVQRYHSMCSLNYGIESLKAAAEKAVSDQEDTPDGE